MVKRGKKKKRSKSDLDKKKIIKKYVCPKCKSKDIHSSMKILRILGISKFTCNKCKYEDKIFPLLVV